MRMAHKTLTKAVKGPPGQASPGPTDIHLTKTLGHVALATLHGTVISKSHRQILQVPGLKRGPRGRGLTFSEHLL